jgi:hypothetical protein
MATRISDLPENITMQPANPGGVFPPALETRPGEKLSNDMINSQTTYAPLNVHTSPYGHPPPNPDGKLTNFPENPLEGMPQQRLPSRDIPMNPLEYQHDEAIQANYVPRPKLTSDYIREYEAQEPTRRGHERNKQRFADFDDWMTRFQIPLLVGLLFFIFQMPVFNTFLRQNFTFLVIYNEDGNFNMVGLVLKSALFGSLFYGIQQFIQGP